VRVGAASLPARGAHLQWGVRELLPDAEAIEAIDPSGSRRIHGCECERTPERYRLLEWLSFVGTEIHKKHLFPMFSSRSPDEVKSFARGTAPLPLAHAARHLDDEERYPFLLGKNFTVADAYLFWGLLIAPYGGIEAEAHPSLVRYVVRIRERPAVKRALSAELPLYVAEVGAIPPRPTAAAAATVVTPVARS
jgi:hypothetical protein